MDPGHAPGFCFFGVRETRVSTSRTDACGRHACFTHTNPTMRTSARVFLLSLAVPIAASAQSLDLTIHHTGISFGDSRFVRGVRLNYRDDNLRLVEGINATIWTPYEPARGTVKGLALGLPVTGARTIQGAAIGIFGAGAEHELSGVGIGGFGVGSGGELRGIMLGGFGAGSGGDITGLTVGGFGAGSGGRVTGITIGGFGAGAALDVTGIQLGGFGVGSGGNVTGITIGGFGAGAAGDVKGITIGGFGAGSGGRVSGLTIAGFGAGAATGIRGITIAGGGAGSGGDLEWLTIAGLGAGAGGTMRGIAIAGLGLGAARIRAFALAPAVGGLDVSGLMLAPAWFKVVDDDGAGGRMGGVSLSAFNQVKGNQRGLTIGVVNYAWDLDGVQIGLINYARNNSRGKRLLPFFNKHW